MILKNITCKSAGFTLIETLITVTLMSFVLAGVVKMFSGTGRQHTSQEQIVALTQDLRAAKLLMTSEIRQAGCNPKKKKGFGFQLSAGPETDDTDANSIHFTMDTDNTDGDSFLEPDGLATAPNEDIKYYRLDSNGNILLENDPTPGVLVRDTGAGPQEIAGNIIGLQFAYLNSTGAAVATNTASSLKNIRVVQVTLQGQVEYTAQVSLANQTQTKTFRVLVRNTGLSNI